MPRLFAFDMDGVVYDYDWSRRMAAMSELTGVPEAELTSRWWNHHDGEAQAEAGRYPTGAAYLAALSAALGATVSAADFVRIRRASMTPRPAVVEAVAAAARSGQVTVLTNNGALVEERFAELAPELVPIVGIEHLRTSSRYGARKPHRAVFEAMLRAYRVTPAEAFFTDDLAENVEAARAVGIDAHLYTGAEALRGAIESFAAREGPVR